MKYQDNITEVASLQPDYLGFIFHHQSARHFEGTIPQISDSIQKVGVFVDEKVEFISQQIEKHKLSVIQLHGHESPEICRLLQSTNAKVIKVFSIKDTFDFSVLEPYEEVCDYFLFDTKGKLPGGNGYTFNWSVLEQYASTKPYFLSGGIGLDQVENLKQFQESNASKYCYAIDINSKFEIEPGLKNIKLLKEFKYRLFSNFDLIAKVTYNGIRKTTAKDGYRPHIEFENIDFKTSGSQYFINKQGEVNSNETQIAFIKIVSTDFFNKKLFDGIKFKFYEGPSYIGQGEVLEVLNKKLEK